jgi:formate dehydrogenase subunit delta
MESKPHDEGVSLLASHVNDFWEPRMRRQFFDIIDAGGTGLRPLVLEAAPLIKRPVAA